VNPTSPANAPPGAPPQQAVPLWHRHALPAVIAAASLIIMLSGEKGELWLRYDREAILAGEWWRLVTAHLCHLGWSHLAMNLAGLALIWALFHRFFTTGGWLAVTLVSALAVGLGLLAFNPEIQWYVGLSGVLHGLFLAGLLASLFAGYRLEWLLFLLVVAKLAWEQRYGALPGSADLAGGAVVVDAHFYGALAGSATALLLRLPKSARPAGR